MFKCVKASLIEIKINAIEPGTNSTVPKYNAESGKNPTNPTKKKTKKTLVTSQTGFK